ncbi:glycosyltransferase [Shouchella clausii]|uniref:glycosyltransferase n=1 Tax=Shouchella clausii TaxID=79880 RepID=UPI0021482721|nr:glycosyltransferase family A protein [Shouchella clausii]MCR1287428.1 glycosyltransferase family 2 protein [Shouchella clausii]
MISVITCTNRNDSMKTVFDNYLRQTMKDKELIVILNQDKMDLSFWKEQAKKLPRVSVFQVPGRLSVGECKNIAAEKTAYSHIAKFDDDDYYAPLYLEAAWSAFEKQREADIVGKSSVYFYFQKSNCIGLFPSLYENEFAKQVVDSTLVFKKELLKDVSFPKIKVGSDKKFQRDCHAKGFRIFSTDRYNHAVIRSRNPNHHTWKISDEQLLKGCINLVYTEDYKPLVTSQV